MRKFLAGSILILYTIFLADISYAGMEKDAYRASYVCNDKDGNKRWQATAEIKPKDGNVYTITERMEGLYGGFDGKISWVASTDFEMMKDSLKPLNMEQHIFDHAGREIAVSTQEFNYKDKTVVCIYKDLVNNTVSRKEFKFSKDVVNRLLQGLIGQKFIESGSEFKDMQVISPEPAIYNFRLKNLGNEKIEVNGVKYEACKIAFDPMLGMFNFVKVFLPKSYAWHSSEPIFEWLKYEGLESGVDSPRVEIVSTDKAIARVKDKAF